MKKFCYSLAAAALAPAIVISVANSALAQRRNTTSHDVPPAQALEHSDKAPARNDTDNKMIKHDKHNRKDTCDCKDQKNCMKHCDKKMHDDRKDKKHHEWMREERDEVEENHNEALAKIRASSLSSSQKDLLIKHADENKDLMLRQLDERQQLMQAHIRQYKNDGFPTDSKADRKAVKKVNKILTD